MSTVPGRTQPVDVHEMVVIHRVFRRELSAIPVLVRSASDRDTSRAALIGDHIRLVLDGLHLHHTGEDTVLWPRLLERAAASKPCIDVMLTQHQQVTEHVRRVEPLLTAWLSSGSEADGDELSGAVDQLAATLVEHLDLEERTVLPLIARHITAREWAKLGEHGREAMSARQRPLLFGLIMQDASGPERAALLASMPAPMRLLLRTVGAHHYRRYIRRLWGPSAGVPDSAAARPSRRRPITARL